MATVENILQHYGVKGMRWGVRRAGRGVARGVNDILIKSPPKTQVTLRKPKAKPTPSDDVKKAETAKAKIHGRKNTKALSNDELQSLVKRMRLEQEFARLQGDPKALKAVKKGGSLTAEILGGAGKQVAKNTAATVMTKELEKLLKKK